MPWKGIKIPHAWRSTPAAIAIGLLAPMIVLGAPQIETAIFHNRPGHRLFREFYDTVDTSVYDGLFLNRGPHEPEVSAYDRSRMRQAETGASFDQKPSIPEVVIVAEEANDATTIRSLYPALGIHGPPYPRRVMADLVRKLSDAGAVVIGFDLIFGSESSYNRPTINDDDKAFAQAMKRSGNVVLSAEFAPSTTERLAFQWQNAAIPIPELRHAARAIAPADVSRDYLDGEIRGFYPTVEGPDDPDLPLAAKSYPTFAPMIAALYMRSHNGESGHPAASDHKFDSNLAALLDNHRFLNGPLPLRPIDSQSPAKYLRTVNICFAGYPGPNTCAIHSLGETLEPANARKLKQWFSGRIVLVGSMDPAGQDRYKTPLMKEGGWSRDNATNNAQQVDSDASNVSRYGVDVHANIIHTLLDQHLYREFDARRRTALICVFGLITALLVARLRPVLSLLPIVGMLALFGWLVVSSFRAHFVFLRPTEVFLATFVGFALESVYFYAVEDRRARQARTTFQRYVGPQVMERVLDTNFKPGTVEERHLTIMFTDVQGFTSLSEKMSPHEVVATFNRYLNEMVEIIDRHGGTLDKIMGDGVMAYFNAPLPLAHHEQSAVECALDMQAAMRSWRELSEGLGLPPLKVRIGINCGDVVFGEVGAKRQLGYTVIGDAVNAAARLEPLNKEFKTEILVSEAVLEKLDNTIETVYVGELAIRGREEGIRAYSVTGRKAAAHAN